MKLLGVDFTSAPRHAKPIRAAWARLEGSVVRLERIESSTDWPQFEHLLQTPGPWVGAFDLPFGMPREMVRDLNWPTRWPELVRHARALGKEGFKRTIDDYRATRAPGNKFAHRATDHPAGSSSPMKLVNPPVALMFQEGTPRLADAGLHLPGLHPNSDTRIALEGYPGHTARTITRASYKSDTRKDQTPARATARAHIIATLTSGDNALSLTLHAPHDLLQTLQDDASGDHLDATLCAMQAGWAATRSQTGWGLPADIDPIEGWIVSVV